ncbi:MAG: M67 family peptidase [Candidatus Latescibacteria bacterium]|nr:M67 family peptidase [Candidatus Latescibacterota bacterium]
MLRLSGENWAYICDHARRDYPAECCGIITRSKDGACEVRSCVNIQDRLHEKMPDRHPRDSRTAYRMDDLEVFRILEAAERSGKALAGFYHSHIDCDAYFSEEDRTAAMFGEDPAYPGAVYLVMSVYGREVKGYKAFVWEGESKGFQEVAVVRE